MYITAIGLDIAKSVFHLVGADNRGKQMLKKRLKRTQVMEYFGNLSPRSGHGVIYDSPRDARKKLVGGKKNT